MSWSFIVFFNRLTGATPRRNRALRHATDWAEMINKFYTAHNLSGDMNVDKLVENAGSIVFEISVFAHKGRDLVHKGKNFRNKQLVEIIKGMVADVESTRRYLFSPAAQKEKLRQVLVKLRSSNETLQKTLAEIKRH